MHCIAVQFNGINGIFSIYFVEGVGGMFCIGALREIVSNMKKKKTKIKYLLPLNIKLLFSEKHSN